MKEMGQKELAESLLKAYRELEECEGWKNLLQITKDNMEERQRLVMLHPHKVESERELGFLCGEYAGWRFLTELPSTMIQEQLEVLELIKKDRRKEDG